MANVLKIKAHTTTTTTKELEVTLPYYCKDVNTIVKIESESEAIMVVHSDYYSTISAGLPEMFDHVIARAAVCSEHEYLKAVDLASRRIKKVVSPMVYGDFDEMTEEDKRQNIADQLYTLNSAS